MSAARETRRSNGGVGGAVGAGLVQLIWSTTLWDDGGWVSSGTAISPGQIIRVHVHAMVTVNTASLTGVRFLYVLINGAITAAEPPVFLPGWTPGSSQVMQIFTSLELTAAQSVSIGFSHTVGVPITVTPERFIVTEVG